MNREQILKIKQQNRELAKKLNLKGNIVKEIEELKSPIKRAPCDSETSKIVSDFEHVIKNKCSEEKELFEKEKPVEKIKGEQFNKAWKNLIQHGDPILFDKIVHPEYHTINHGVKINKEQSKRVLLKRKGHAVMGPYSVLYENNDFLCIHRYTRVDKYSFFSLISGVSYKDGLVFTQQTAREILEKDPSKEMGWSWSEYET